MGGGPLRARRGIPRRLRDPRAHGLHLRSRGALALLERLDEAIAEARERGYRPPPLGVDFHRHLRAPGRGRVHLRRGDGAAQLAQGRRGEPRQQAAVPRRRRALRLPTIVNNVETLVSFSSSSRRERSRLDRKPPRTAGSLGTRFFGVAATSPPRRLRGAVRDWFDALFELAGGVPDGRKPADRAARRRGGHVPRARRSSSLPLTFEGHALVRR